MHIADETPSEINAGLLLLGLDDLKRQEVDRNFTLTMRRLSRDLAWF